MKLSNFESILLNLFAVLQCLQVAGQNSALELYPPTNVAPLTKCTFDSSESCFEWRSQPPARVQQQGSLPYVGMQVAKEGIRTFDETANRTFLTVLSYLTTPPRARGQFRLATDFLTPSAPLPVRALCLTFMYSISGLGTKLSLYERTSQHHKLVWSTAGQSDETAWLSHTSQFTVNNSVSIEIVAEIQHGSAVSSILLDDLILFNSTCTKMLGDSLLKVNYSGPSYADNPEGKRRPTWETNVIPYSILPGFNRNQTAMLNRFFKEISRRTCVSFEPYQKSSEDEGLIDYIEISKQSSGCLADVGRVGIGKQSVKLADACFSYAILSHTLLHTLGLRHENTRSDRHSFVKVNWENIRPGSEALFYSFPTNQSILNVPYDVNSVMHFSNTEMARLPHLKTIEDLYDAENLIGPISPSVGPTRFDFAKIRNLYCPSAGSASTTTTPTPPERNPLDFRPCRNTTRFQVRKSMRIASHVRTNGLYRASEDCRWEVRASSGYLQLTIDFMDLEQSPNCSKDSLAIYDGSEPIGNQLLFLGCGSKLISGSFKSSSDVLLLVFQTDHENFGVGFQVTLDAVQWTDSPFVSDFSAAYLPIDCSFEVTSCGWANDPSYTLLWKRQKLPALPNDRTVGSAEGNYIAVEAANPTSKAVLMSRRLRAADDWQCFWFSYQNNGGKLEVWLADDSSESNRLLWRSPNKTTSDWETISLPLQIDKERVLLYSLRLEATVANRKIIAIDDTGISPVPCFEEENLFCNFDQGSTCAWTIRPDSRASWILKTGRSSSGSYSVTKDYSGNGTYLLAYQKAYSLSAFVRSGVPVYLDLDYVSALSYKCLEFYYMKRGSRAGYLKVQMNGNTKLFEATRNPSSVWQLARVNLTARNLQGDTFNLSIEALVNGLPDSDIALDNILLSKDECANLPLNHLQAGDNLPQLFCDFEAGDLCGDTFEFAAIMKPGNNYRWFDPVDVEAGIYGEIADHTTHSKSGHVAMVKGGVAGELATMETNSVKMWPNGLNCLSFWYFFGNSTRSSAELSVLYSTPNRMVRLRSLKPLTSNKNKWTESSVRLAPRNLTTFQIKFQAFSGGTQTVIAIDDTKIFQGSC